MTPTRTTIVPLSAVLAATTIAVGAQSPPLLTLEQAVSEALIKNERMLNQR